MRIARLVVTALVLLVSFVSTGASALNIVVSNDDGFETANIRALYERLRAAGHDVVISSPTQNNSGRGGFIRFLEPLTPLTTATRYGTIAAGSPAVGNDPADNRIFYVDGTPVMSLLYGLDVVAPRRWGRAPDLIISGPNEGANTGAIVVSSGTVNNALYGIARGIPSIAVSWGNSGSRSYRALTSGAVEYELADIVVAVVRQLEATRTAGQPLLPRGLGLNINVPDFTAGNGRRLRFALTQIGGYEGGIAPVFYERLSQSPIAGQVGLPAAALQFPGISLVQPGIPAPTGVVIPTDAATNTENKVLAQNLITVSFIQWVPQAVNVDRRETARVLSLTQ